MTYETNGALKTVELDNWERGCQLEGAQSYFVNWKIEAETLAEIKQKIMDFVGCDMDGIVIDACEEAGRIDAQVTENADGYIASESELASWKRGELELYAVTYSFLFEQVTRSPANFS